MPNNPIAENLASKINKREAVIGIIGLGYVGLPLALAFTEKGFRVLGFDVDPEKVEKINRGESYIKHLDPTRLTQATGQPLPDDEAGGGAGGKFEIRNPKFEIRNQHSSLPTGPLNRGKRDQDLPNAQRAQKSEIRNSKSEISKGEGGREIRNPKFEIRNSPEGAGREFKIQNSKFKIEASKGPRLTATADFNRLAEADAILICVPTPLGPHKEPDMRYVESSTRAVRQALRPGQLVILESTTYPGTTDDLLRPILESPLDPHQTAPETGMGDGKFEIRNQHPSLPPDSLNRGKRDQDLPNAQRADKFEIRNSKSEISEGVGGNSEFRIPNSEFKCGENFFLAFSPEREDPGNPSFSTTNTPKVVGGVDPVSGDLAQTLYDQIIERTVRVSSARIAEASKLTENIFRSINIALVNELKIIYDRLGIDVWEVLDAAATKPFGFMRFNPGPGLGGHCIPLDPFYLAWRAREAGVPTKFIELAGEINTSMPGYVIEKLQAALNDRGKTVKGAKTLVLGLAYKPNIDDPRESPSFEIIDRLLSLGAEVSYHDPHIPVAPSMRSWPDLPPMESQPLTEESLRTVDAAIVITDHKAVDYNLVLDHAPLIIDTRGVYRDHNGKVHPA